MNFRAKVVPVFLLELLTTAPANCSRLRKPSQVKTVPVGETPPDKIAS